MANQSEDITIISVKPGQEDERDLGVHLKEENLREQVTSTRELFSTIQEELDQRGEDWKEGLSFLDLKNDTLLSYMIDVCNIVLRKARGESIEGHNSIDRCVEYRVILEKVKAIDQKLAYQLNKLITLPDDAQEEDQRIDVHNLDVDLEGIESENEPEASASADEDSDQTDDESDEELDEENESGDNEDEDKDENDDESEILDGDESDESSKNVRVQKPKQSKAVKASGVYKPPKLRSVAYLEKGDSRGKGRRKNYDEFYQDDDDARDIVNDHTALRVDKDRVRYEEDNYTRLPDENPKKTKRKLKTKEYRKKNRGNKFKRRK